MSDRLAVVTGVGVISPGANGVAAFWDLLSAGRTATRPISLFEVTDDFRSRIAAEADFDPIALGLTEEEATSWDRAAQMAVLATTEAIGDSGGATTGLPPGRIGVSLGSAVGCTIDRKSVV